MIKRSSSLLIIIAAGMISAAIWWMNTKKTTHTNLRSAVYATERGWGYNIFAGDSLFIHQDWIPALPVQHGFQTKEQATEVAEKVMANIREKGSPTLKREEVEQVLANN